jgi:hypothetical protein
MSHRFLHVGFHNFEMTSEITTELNKTFDFATHWARYAPNCWLLWTGVSIEEWSRRISLTQGLPNGYGVLILTVDPLQENRGGLTFEFVWKWLKEKQ